MKFNEIFHLAMMERITAELAVRGGQALAGNLTPAPRHEAIAGTGQFFKKNPACRRG